ncbi:MAG: cell envelope biogenesis protein LolA [Prevotella sp.]|nr:cell envelope biogenesis protein LolA [Prevotella sp.]
MKKILITLAFIACGLTTMTAQTAKQVLDKCAQTVSNKDGVKADFTMQSAQYGSASGTIAVKGRMFNASTKQSSMWFDGKTLWTYMAKSDEVNVTTPTEAQLQALNPYNFINLYKQGFKYTMTKSDKAFNVHLTATDQKRKIRELFIIVDKTTYQPTEVKMLQNSKWTTFTISNLKTTKLSDATFKFNSKDFPSAEVIDLR